MSRLLTYPDQPRVNACTTLPQLRDVLLAIEAEITEARRIANGTEAEYSASQDRIDLRVNVEDLPTFGGEAPADTRGVWSWDEAGLLVGDGGDWRILPRQGW